MVTTAFRHRGNGRRSSTVGNRPEQTAVFSREQLELQDRLYRSSQRDRGNGQNNGRELPKHSSVEWPGRSAEDLSFGHVECEKLLHIDQGAVHLC